jgi:hypothetical protein
VVAEITRQGGKAVAVPANVAKQADVERLFSEAKRAFGRLDILVNNAGIFEFFPLEGVTEERFPKHFDVNVLGVLLASKEAVRHFDAAGGSIINVGSGASTLPLPNTSVYGATKAAVDVPRGSGGLGASRAACFCPRPLLPRSLGDGDLRATLGLLAAPAQRGQHLPDIRWGDSVHQISGEPTRPPRQCPEIGPLLDT